MPVKATTIGKAQRLDAARQAFWTHDHISVSPPPAGKELPG
jgi:hypothetical protein